MRGQRTHRLAQGQVAEQGRSHRMDLSGCGLKGLWKHQNHVRVRWNAESLLRDDGPGLVFDLPRQWLLVASRWG